MVVEACMAQPIQDKISTRIGFIQKFILEIKLVLRLIRDRRVHPLAKILPIAAIIYWILPDFAPGPVDDALVLWFGFYVFIELCPQEIVEEHRQALLKVIPGQWHDSPQGEADPQIVDGEFREL
jgi:hypothetical protein